MSDHVPLSRILVVAACPDVRHRTLELLTTEGYDATACGSVGDAIESVRSQQFGIVAIVMDDPDRQAASLMAVLDERAEIEPVIVNVSTTSGSDATPLPRDRSLSKGESEGIPESDAMPSSDVSNVPWIVLGRVGVAMAMRWQRYAQQVERALAERSAALLKPAEPFRQLADHIHQVVWVASAKHRELVYVNQAYETVWGRTRASLYAQPLSFLHVVHPDDRDRLLSAWSRLGDYEWRETFRIVRDDGVRWIHSRAIPVVDEGGAVAYLTVVSEDITDRQRVEETLRKSEQRYRYSSKLEALGTLAGGIAHDFNNILTAILGYTELALATVPKESRAQRNLQEVLTAGHRAKHLIQQILTFSRQGSAERTPLQLESVLREAFTLLRATIPTTIDIRVHLLSEATVLADAAQLHQVIVNLCANAEYAMREQGGTLDLTIEDVEITEHEVQQYPALKPGPYVRLTVRDTGIGMAPEFLERMFDPFFTTKQIGEGSGMGLAVVHGIVTSHGGAVYAESTPGRGTSVMVYLPAMSTVQSGVPPLPEHALVGKESILFIDDEEALVRLGQELLSRLGYRVEVRTDSLEALELFRENPERFDLVITDQTMPMMTGEHLARELLKLRPSLPIILCTGFSHTMTAERAKALGIRAYLMKPLAIRDLAPIVRHVLDEDPIILSRNPGS